MKARYTRHAEGYLKLLKELVNKGYYSSVNAAIREGERLLVEEHIKYGHIEKPVSLTEEQIDHIVKKLVEDDYYKDAAELSRIGIRELIKKKMKEIEREAEEKTKPMYYRILEERLKKI